MREMLAQRGVKGFCKPMPKVSKEEAEAEAKAESEAIARAQMNYKTHLSQMSLDEINELLKDPISRTELTPPLTSNAGSTSRPAGQNKCEKWFKDNGLIKNGSQLGTKAIAQVMGFPSNWFEGLTRQYSKNQMLCPCGTTPSQGASRRLASRPPRGDDLG
jgi:hypothetical protein